MIPHIVLLISRLLNIVQKFFVLQTEQWIPPFKLNMSQPSSMFVVGDIIQIILDAFFLGHPVQLHCTDTHYIFNALALYILNGR